MPPPLHAAQRPYPGYPIRPEHPLETARKCLIWGWWIAGGGCLFAMIPFLGVLSWFILFPVEITGFVLAIVAIAKGRVAGGIGLLLFSVCVVPVTMIFAPILSSLLGVAATVPALPPAQHPAGSSPSWNSTATSSSRPTTDAELAAERKEIERQLDARARLRR